MRRLPGVIVALFVLVGIVAAQEPAPKIGKLPHIEINGEKKQVRVECEMLAVNAPLEFYCCVKGSNDYESMLRSQVKPSDLHFALLAVGLKPGQPLTYSEAAKKWTPPQGPPLHIWCEYEKDGKTVTVPASRWMRDVKTKKEPPPFTWVFTGSRTIENKYAADVTGYLVSIVNFDLTVIDIPLLASSANETLEWERNPDITPKAGTKVWMILEAAGNAPAGKNDAPKAGAGQDPGHAPDAPRETKAAPTTQASDVDGQVAAAETSVKALRDQWQQRVAPQRGALRQAAEAHYRIMADLRKQQQKLIDAADRVQRTIDELEKDYQDLTTPRPEGQGS